MEEFLAWYRECLIYRLMDIVSGLNLVFNYTFLFNTVNSRFKKIYSLKKHYKWHFFCRKTCLNAKRALPYP